MNAVLTFISFPITLLQASVWDDPIILLWVVTGFVFITIILVLVSSVYLLQVIRAMARDAAMDKAKRTGTVYQEEPSFWDKLWSWSNQSVPVEKEETILLDHNYDGIRELDNHLPPWWKWLFYATVIWGAFYLFSYHITSSFPLQTEEYETELAIADEAARNRKSTASGPIIDETNVELTSDATALADGKTTFTSICASCHRVDGGGDIGPNLTDNYWKHGADIKSVFKVVSKGVQGTNMVAWGTSMSPEKIRNVSSYVLSLKDSNPPNGKAPEGELVNPATAPADTIKNSGKP